MKVADIVKEKILEELKKGNIPWMKPWIAKKFENCAFSRFSKKPYSLINQLLLGKPGEYGTFAQWSSIGGKIRAGEKGSFIVFYKILEIDEKKEDKDDEEKGKKTIPYLKYHTVFHISQVEGVEPLPETETKKVELNPIEEAENIINEYITVNNIGFYKKEGDRACYNITLDSITVPLLEQFKDIAEYYSTVFHECIHSTGAVTRLNRPELKSGRFGNETYAKEELVAEMGSAILLCHTGIGTSETQRNNAAYIQSWMKAIKENSGDLIVKAASQAEKAVDFFLGIKEEEVNKENIA